MPAITRRALSASLFVAAAFSVLPLQAQAAEELKIGYQKTGLPVIARQQGVRMPGFFGYMAWSGAVLVPVFIISSLIFFG